MLFSLFLKRLMHRGTIRLITAGGREYITGDGAAPRITIRLHRKSLEWSLGFRPDLILGEAYMNGSLTVEEGTLRDFIQLLFANYAEVDKQPFFRAIEYLNGRFRKLRQFNPYRRARKNVAYHYDLPDDIYALFLDSDRQYSCGYFTDPKNTLEQAQLDKKCHIASKLLLNRPNLRVLDIGSGWGGLGLYLAREASCDVTGITLSENQHKISQQRAWAEGLSRICHFKLQDYREETGPYDRIVSVGMFEHVGKKNYQDFFDQIRNLLADDGVCLLHTISRFDEPAQVNAFIRKYIFPGTDVPALSEIMEVVERSGLFVNDIEPLRLHYAETLKNWAQRFQAHKNAIVSRYGADFYRKWEFYLVSCEMGFRYQYMMVAQIQLSKRLETVPVTRDYMYQWEKAHRSEMLPERQKAS